MRDPIMDKEEMALRERLDKMITSADTPVDRVTVAGAAKVALTVLAKVYDITPEAYLDALVNYAWSHIRRPGSWEANSAFDMSNYLADGCADRWWTRPQEVTISEEALEAQQLKIGRMVDTFLTGITGNQCVFAIVWLEANKPRAACPLYTSNLEQTDTATLLTKVVQDIAKGGAEIVDRGKDS